MKSKISFFNWTVFRKNCKLFGAIPVLYLLVLIVMIPVRLFSSFTKITRPSYGLTGDELVSSFYESVMEILDLNMGSIICFTVAVVTVMALWGYMFNTKSANMIHSLPITRRELFGTNLITGVLFMGLPLLITFVACQVLFIINEFPDIKILGIWLLAMFAMSLVAFGIALFCAQFTGQLFAVPLYFAVLNVLYIGIRVIVFSVIELFVIGAEPGSRMIGGPVWLSPFVFIEERVHFDQIIDDTTGYIVGSELATGLHLGMYALFGIFIILISYLMYRKRPIENAGDFITIGFLKPVFRWGTGSCGGFLAALIIFNLFNNEKSLKYYVIFMVLALAAAIALFFISQMFIEKNFKVINVKRCLECLGLIVFMTCCFFIMIMCGRKTTNYIPDADEIEYAYIDMDYVLEFSGEDVETVRQLHKTLIDNYEVYNSEDAQFTYYIYLSYVLKSGEIVNRNYYYPANDLVCKTVDEKIVLYEKDEKNLSKYLLGDNLDELEDSAKSTAVYLYFSGQESAKNYEYEKEQTKEITKALIKDIEEGSLNSYYSSTSEERFADYNEESASDGESDEEKVYCELTLSYSIDDIDGYSEMSLRSNNINLLENFKNRAGYASSGYITDSFSTSNSTFECRIEKNRYTIFVNRSIVLNESCKNTIEVLESYGLNIY